VAVVLSKSWAEAMASNLPLAARVISWADPPAIMVC
jgi:hypothetical protein